MVSPCSWWTGTAGHSRRGARPSRSTSARGRTLTRTPLKYSRLLSYRYEYMEPELDKTEHLLTANEIHFICGGKYCRYRRHWRTRQIIQINPRRPSRQEPVSLSFTKVWEKGLAEPNTIRGKKCWVACSVMRLCRKPVCFSFLIFGVMFFSCSVLCIMTKPSSLIF